MGLSLKEVAGKGTFERGIHPPERKHFASDATIEVIPTPEKVVLPLIQHIGAPCESIVKPKQEVAFGEIVAKGKGFVSASVYSPIAGVVQKPAVVTLPNGRHLSAVVIKASGDQIEGNQLLEEVLGGQFPKDKIDGMRSQEVLDAILNAGIVGLGGAAFPTHVKLAPDEKRIVDTILINGCECEPYLACDYRLMVERAEPIVIGALLAAKATGAKKIIVGIEDNKPNAVEALTEAAKGTEVAVAVLKTKYPQGSEKQLIKAILDREVPVGSLPLNVGVVVMNVGTAAAVARAVYKKKPLTHRVICVTGDGIKTPKNVLAPIGISYGELVKFCGGLTDDAARMISGGPMMGFSFSNMDTPVTKGTSGLTVMTQTDLKREAETTCVRCGRCVDVCPMNLVPTKCALAARHKDTSLALRYHIMACFECGSCAYICPANLPLVQLIRTGKTLVTSNK